VSTTIQVSRRTLQLLSTLKKMKAQSYDELFLKLAMEKLNLPQSMFGSNPKLASFTEEEEAGFHEL